MPEVMICTKCGYETNFDQDIINDSHVTFTIELRCVHCLRKTKDREKEDWEN